MLCITTGLSMRPLMLQGLFWSKEKLVFTTKDLRLRLLLKVMVFRTLKWPSAWITHLKNIWHWLQHFLLIIPNPTYHPLACCVFYNRKSVDSILSWSKINKKKKSNVMVPWCLLHKLSTIQGTSAGTLKSLLPKSWGSPLQRI